MSECRMQNEGKASLSSFCILHSALCILLLLTGCWKDDMADEAHIKPMESTTFFPDGKTARPLINGTVPRGGKTINDPLYAVTVPQGPPAANFPFPMTADDIEKGRQQFNIFCAVCHGATGHGDGMIVQRGFPRPPSFYLPRLRNSPHGHFYDVITHGFGAMYSYGDRIREKDRWRIVAYVRALQLSTPNDSGQNDMTTTAPSAAPQQAPAETQPAARRQGAQAPSRVIPSGTPRGISDAGGLRDPSEYLGVTILINR